MPQGSSRIHWQDRTPENPAPQPSSSQAGPERQARPDGPPSLLDTIGRDLTRLAREGRLKPLFGRQPELRQLQRILLRKEKNNPLLVGAPGVGKTALVEGLANLIVSGQAARALSNLRIVEITVAGLVSGTYVRGSFEDKLRALLCEVEHESNLILFIDEIHTLVGAGAAGSSDLDAANILKPALARGEIHCIGATTSDEFDRFLKSDPAFERRFEPLTLEEPTESEAIDIIKAALPAYEQHHQVRILPEAAEAAVRLSTKNILDRQLPDKAFDLLDAACAYVRLPEPDEHPLPNTAQVDAQAVSQALADKLHIPTEKLSLDMRERLAGLDEFFSQRIIGQPFVVDRVGIAIKGAYAGLGKPNQPRYVFGFFGGSGVGKTEMAKALAEFLFDSPDAMIRLDMSEYKEPHTVSRLLGSPPGYVGYYDEGTFATRLRHQPFSIVLLDEIEKAHPEVHNTFLQIFDNGRFTDTHGRIIDARQAIFVLTSNLFTISTINSKDEYDESTARVREQLCSIFRPEYINRINEIVLFSELKHEDLVRIARIEVASINQRLSNYGITVEASEEALNWVAQTAFDPTSGARAVLRLMNREIEQPVSERLVQAAIPNPSTLKVVVENDRLIVRDKFH